jgi:hypothetical protein
MKTLGNILWHIPFLGFLSAISVTDELARRKAQSAIEKHLG